MGDFDTTELIKSFRRGLLAGLQGAHGSNDAPEGHADEAQEIAELPVAVPELFEADLDVHLKLVCNRRVTHSSSSSAGGASAVTGAGSSTPDPTEGEPSADADRRA